jgi:hypothetical protein
VLQGTVERRAGQTIYTRVGRTPMIVLAALLVLAGVVARRRGSDSPDLDGSARGPSELEQDGDRPVVDDLDLHVGAEPAGGDLRTELP